MGEFELFWTKFPKIAEKEKELGSDMARYLERMILLQVVDTRWKDHLYAMDALREGIGLRAYGQRDPLVEYKNEGHKAFGQLLATIDSDIAENILKAGVSVQQKPVQQPHVIESGKKEIGRNDLCPCGSGKKWKRCGMLNTTEHQQLMAKK